VGEGIMRILPEVKVEGLIEYAKSLNLGEVYIDGSIMKRITEAKDAGEDFILISPRTMQNGICQYYRFNKGILIQIDYKKKIEEFLGDNKE